MDTIQAQHVLPYDILAVHGRALTVVDVRTVHGLTLIEFDGTGVIARADALVVAVDLGPRVAGLADFDAMVRDAAGLAEFETLMRNAGCG